MPSSCSRACSCCARLRAARYEYASVLVQRHKYLQAIEETNKLLPLEPHNSAYRTLYANACGGLGRHDEALQVYRELLVVQPAGCGAPPVDRSRPEDPRRQAEAIESYREAAATRRATATPTGASPTSRPIAFADDELARMRGQEGRRGDKSRGPLSPVLRARQGARGSRRVRRVIPLLRARQRIQEEREPLQGRSDRA